MTYSCPLCEVMPSSHSLKKKTDEQGNLFFYTSPAQATLYYDAPGIIQHYDGVWSEVKQTGQSWVWVFDSLGFTLAHALQMTVARELARLICRKFSHQITKIIIINPTFYVRMTHRMVMPFLDKSIQEKIVINTQARCFQDIVEQAKE